MRDRIAQTEGRCRSDGLMVGKVVGWEATASGFVFLGALALFVVGT